MGRLDDPRTEGRLLLLAGDLLTVLLLTAGCALSFLSGYEIKTDRGAVLAFCVLASAVSAAVHTLSRPWWSLALAGGIAAVFRLTWKETLPVLAWLGRKMGLMPVLTGLPLSSLTPDQKKLMPVLLLLCAAMAWLLGLAAVRLRAWYLAALLTLAPVLPAINTGVLPAWGAMLAAFIGWGALLLTSLFGRKDAGSLGRARLLSLAGMAALVMALVMCLPMEGYVRPQWATDARNGLIRGVTRQMERFFDLETLEGGLLADLGLDLSLPGEGTESASAPEGGSGLGETAGGGSNRREDLLAAGSRRYIRRRILSVSTDQTGGGRIYLRGGSLGIYTGDSWEMVEKGGGPFFSEGTGAPEAQPSLYPARTAADGTEYTIRIREIYYQDVRFYPYRLTDSGGWTDESGVLPLPEDDGWAEGFWRTGSEIYRVGYIPGGPGDGFTPLSGALAEEEARYRADVVYDRYLDVPYEARRTLEPLLSGDYRDHWTMVIQSLEQELESAEGAEREALEASLGRMRELADGGLTLEDFGGAVELPEGMEEWRGAIIAASRTAALLAELAAYDLNVPAMEPGEDFVTHFLEEGRGYCVHFATAGALLLRMQGIPARYVTGYTVQLNSQGGGDVLDSDAHAWVEIYLDGYGWHPVEMTPGYAGGGTGVELAGALDEDIPDGTDTPEPDETPEEEVPDAPGPEDRPEEKDLPDEETEEAGTDAAASRRVLGRAAPALGALCILYALSLLPRNLARRDPDTNRSALRAYRRYRRVLRLGGVEDEVLEELGRKARFSQHTLTEEERTAAWSHLEAAAETARTRQKKLLRRLFPLLRPIL